MSQCSGRLMYETWQKHPQACICFPLLLLTLFLWSVKWLQSYNIEKSRLINLWLCPLLTIFPTHEGIILLQIVWGKACLVWGGCGGGGERRYLYQPNKSIFRLSALIALLWTLGGLLNSCFKNISVLSSGMTASCGKCAYDINCVV